MTFSSMTSDEVATSLELVEIKPGVKFGKQILIDILPDVETLLFFCKLYDMDHVQVSSLLRLLFRTSLVDALTNGAHCVALQNYVLDLAYQAPGLSKGDITITPTPPSGEILPEIWKDLEVTVAQSIKDVAAKLESVVTSLPGKQGRMVLKSMMVMNAKRPTVGDFKARIHHDPIKENLLVLDVSGSMSEPTIRAIIDDVVALSYEANAHMAVVSNTTTYWTPGSYSVDDVLAACEFGGTQYETLEPLFQRDWGVVICVADYDSSYAAKDHLARNCNGSIDLVLDVSLVNRPTYLAECIGQGADEIRPMLIGNSHYVLNR